MSRVLSLTCAYVAEQAMTVLPDHQDLDAEERVTDMLTNLMHYCHQEGISFESRLRMAEIHFSEEQDQ